MNRYFNNTEEAIRYFGINIDDEAQKIRFNNPPYHRPTIIAIPKNHPEFEDDGIVVTEYFEVSIKDKIDYWNEMDADIIYKEKYPYMGISTGCMYTIEAYREIFR